MPAPRICDKGGCPALAGHHIDLYGQDFHFCNHHWAEVAPAIGELVNAGDRQLERVADSGDEMLVSPIGSGAR